MAIGECVLDPQSRFHDRHQPNRAINAFAGFQFDDHTIDISYLLGRLNLGNQYEVRRFRNYFGQILQPQRQLVDANHAFASAEIDSAQGVAYKDSRGIFFGVVNRIFQIKNDCVRPMQCGVNEILRFSSGEIEPRAP